MSIYSILGVLLVGLIYYARQSDYYRNNKHWMDPIGRRLKLSSIVFMVGLSAAFMVLFAYIGYKMGRGNWILLISSVALPCFVAWGRDIARRMSDNFEVAKGLVGGAGALSLASAYCGFVGYSRMSQNLADTYEGGIALLVLSGAFCLGALAAIAIAEILQFRDAS